MPATRTGRRHRTATAEGAWFVGIDGGGTRTTALVADAHGRIVGRARAGPGNPNAVGWPRALANLERALRAALLAARASASARARVPTLRGICLGLAGAGAPGVARRAAGFLRSLGLARRVRVVTDGAILLAAGQALRGPGLAERRSRSARPAPARERRRVYIALVAGTGSLCWGRSPTGTEVRCGGWGPLVGDEGAGYWLGRAVLRLCARSLDGRARAPRLERALAAQAGVADAEVLVRRFARGEPAPRDVARLAPAVFRLADAGEPGCVALVARAAEHLAAMTTQVARSLSVTDQDGVVELILGGGVLVGEPGLRRRLLAGLGFRPHSVRVVREPALGAVLLAQDAAGSAGA